jgi:DNA-binding response OmpR family regulator
MTIAKRILIADDDEDLVEVLAHRCRMAGLNVETASNGMMALQKIESFEPDLTVMDVNMSFGTGLDVCEMITRDPVLAAIPVIVLTGRKDNETRERCQFLHAKYVAKCPDVWSRLEPLINEKLGLSISQAKAVARANRGCPPEPQHVGPLKILDKLRNHTVPPEPTRKSPASDEPLSEEDRKQEQYIDSIFSAFGGSKTDDDVESAQARALHDFSQSRVLCIDDDNDLLNLLKLRLEQHGIEIEQARGGTEGYRQAFRNEVQAIILDYEMPNGNGDYVLRRLKENPVTSKVPVIVLSGRKDRTLERTLSNMGAVRYLTKPIDWDKLLGELKQHVRMVPKARLS